VDKDVMNDVVLIYTDDFKKLDYGPGHPMRGDRYGKALNEFKKTGLLEKLIIKKPENISEGIVGLFHTADYINKVREVSNTGQGNFGEEVPGFKGIYDIALLSVSASVTAADYVTDDDFRVGINICGGWHHAFEDRGRGFCIFNDIAVVCSYLLSRKNIKRIMVVDYDAHHGDGTQRAFYDNSKVYTVSYHQNPLTLYPFRSGYENEIGKDEGEGFNKNFTLSAFCDDEEFISKFSYLPALIENFNPEIVVVQMGVDGSKECSISTMNLSKEAYSFASKTIKQVQDKLKFKIICLGGGGFVHPILGENWGVQIENFNGMFHE
jgi:acetoin utilization protein AcuC